MNDTAKPTPNKGCTVKLWDRANFRYFVSDEAVDVYHETNLTPRQLLEQRNKLINLLEEFMLSDMDHPLFDDAHKLISDIKNGKQK